MAVVNALHYARFARRARPPPPSRVRSWMMVLPGRSACTLQSSGKGALKESLTGPGWVTASYSTRTVTHSVQNLGTPLTSLLFSWSLTCDFVLSDCNLYKTRMRSVAFSMRTVLPHKSPQKLVAQQQEAQAMTTFFKPGRRLRCGCGVDRGTSLRAGSCHLVPPAMIPAQHPRAVPRTKKTIISF